MKICFVGSVPYVYVVLGAPNLGSQFLTKGSGFYHLGSLRTTAPAHTPEGFLHVQDMSEQREASLFFVS